MKETLFISDLHLDPSRPAITELFFRLLDTRAHNAEALYILGDMFEMWLGDDDPSPASAAVMEALRAVTAGGTPVFVMHGNRDFLIGQGFTARTGCTLLPDAAVVDLYGERTLLMHGDTLCTDDSAYQALRSKVRDPRWQQQMLALPFEERVRLGRQLRDASREETQAKTAEIMDVNQGAVEQALRQHQVRLLIHGHTHRPATHEFELDGHAVRRIVLGDWYEHGSVLSYRPDGHRLETLPVDSTGA